MAKGEGSRETLCILLSLAGAARINTPNIRDKNVLLTPSCSWQGYGNPLRSLKRKKRAILSQGTRAVHNTSPKTAYHGIFMSPGIRFESPTFKYTISKYDKSNTRRENIGFAYSL